MNWDDLQVVLAVARGGTLVRAAETLGVAHTTVGRRLASLEKSLGVRLFDRTPEGFVVTESGDDLRQTAELVEREVMGAQRRLLGRDSELSGALRVSTTDVLFHCLAESFADFCRCYPAIETTVSFSRRTVSLPRREADVVIRASSQPPETLVGRRVGAIQFGVYAARSLVEQVGQGAPLGAYPWIGWDGGPNHRWFESWLEQHAPQARIVLRLDDRGLMLHRAVRTGVGVQLLPCVLADADPDVVRIAPLDPLFSLDLWVLMLHELKGSRRVRAFVTHLANALSANSAAFAGQPDRPVV